MPFDCSSSCSLLLYYFYPNKSLLTYFYCCELKYEGLSRSSWTNVKKNNNNHWIRRINLDITLKGSQNFIQKHKLMTKLHAID